MRRLLDLIALGVVVLILLGMVMSINHGKRREQAIEAARLSVERIQAEVNLLRALGSVETNDRGHPAGVDPSWFDGELPMNPLLPAGQRWMDLAKPGETLRRHPRAWEVEEGDEAMFWYNPVQGVVRARVPRQATPEETRRLYAEVNGLELD
ncbi:MAG: hypothetical protein FJ257_04465 [Phycisphaerae bacterium]|nr:hypothetical protein [Phycisphaerae bacterium]